MQKSLMGICVLATLTAFSGCGDKNDGSEAGSGSFSGSGGNSYSGSYQYKVNGCDTGVQTFSSLEERCQKLADDALNHYCARSSRLYAYQRACGSGMQNAAAETDASGMTDVPVTHSRPRSGPTRAEVQSQQQQSRFPSEITILGKLAPRLDVKTAEEKGAVSTILSGSFAIAGEALPPGDIHLSYSPKVVFEGLPADCTLSVRNFEVIRRSEALVSFTLMGIDTRASIAAGTGCGPALRRFARHGFQARFENAYVVSLGSVGSATVFLSVY